MGEIEVIKPGLFSTIQDAGRFGFMKFGVPQSGAMDSYAARFANLILRNSSDSAVLEITQTGPELRFSHPTEIAICGADISAVINGIPISNNKSYKINSGNILNFAQRKSGSRAYLGISGGFKSDEVLGSKSWYEGITDSYRLEKGMFLKYTPIDLKKGRVNTAIKFKQHYLNTNIVSVFPGPEFYNLNDGQRERLLQSMFLVDRRSNRMAVQLLEALENNLSPIITGPVIPGSVQLTPSGKIIILMRDCQTTGGYPRILQVSEEGLNVVAQKNPGDIVKFHLSAVEKGYL